MSKQPTKPGANDAPKPVGTRIRNIRGALTVRAKKAPPVTLPNVKLGTPRDDSS